jgi:hypothetical protein
VREEDGTKFFKSLVSGAIFKWMELVQADASQARIDAQGDLISLLKVTAMKVEEIEKMDSALKDSQ